LDSRELHSFPLLFPFFVLVNCLNNSISLTTMCLTVFPHKLIETLVNFSKVCLFTFPLFRPVSHHRVLHVCNQPDGSYFFDQFHSAVRSATAAYLVFVFPDA
jgi:hypothetical protein